MDTELMVRVKKQVSLRNPNYQQQYNWDHLINYLALSKNKKYHRKSRDERKDSVDERKYTGGDQGEKVGIIDIAKLPTIALPLLFNKLPCSKRK
jgi:hypothetical protein